MTWIFSTTKEEAATKKKHMFFGIELELSYPENKIADLKLPNTISSGFDFSIHTLPYHSPLELRFHPSTFAWWTKRRKAITTLLCLLAQNGGESNTVRKCGLHIHFDRTLSEEHLINFTQVVYSFPDYMLLLSRRTHQHLEQWASLDNAGLRREDMLRDKFYNKQEAVSLHDKTVELRLFAGTLDPSPFYASLQFADALIQFTNPKHYNWESDCSLDDFRRYVSLCNKRYADLSQVMDSDTLKGHVNVKH